jgi:hypothetical protein
VRREQDFVVLFDLPTLLASEQTALGPASVTAETSEAQRVA